MPHGFDVTDLGRVKIKTRKFVFLVLLFWNCSIKRQEIRVTVSKRSVIPTFDPFIADRLPVMMWRRSPDSLLDHLALPVAISYLFIFVKNDSQTAYESRTSPLPLIYLGKCICGISLSLFIAAYHINIFHFDKFNLSALQGSHVLYPFPVLMITFPKIRTANLRRSLQ